MLTRLLARTCPLLLSVCTAAAADSYYPPLSRGQVAMNFYHRSIKRTDAAKRTVIAEACEMKAHGSERFLAASGTMKVVFAPSARAFLVLHGAPRAMRFRVGDVRPGKARNFIIAGRKRGTTLRATAVYLEDKPD